MLKDKSQGKNIISKGQKNFQAQPNQDAKSLTQSPR
jgi:hypothetical protein